MGHVSATLAKSFTREPTSHSSTFLRELNNANLFTTFSTLFASILITYHHHFLRFSSPLVAARYCDNMAGQPDVQAILAALQGMHEPISPATESAS
jgi:hypothetical protein